MFLVELTQRDENGMASAGLGGRLVRFQPGPLQGSSDGFQLGVVLDFLAASCQGFMGYDIMISN